MFFNENDLLELKINQEQNFVDQFIIVEAGETHTGLKKSYNFDHERFKKYGDKIIYAKFDSFSEEMSKYPNLASEDFINIHKSQPNCNGEDWGRENFQIEYTVKVLRDNNPEPGSLVFFGGLDELFREEAFAKARAIFDKKEKYSLYSKVFHQYKSPVYMDAVVHFELDLYAFKFNLFSKKDTCGLVTTLENLSIHKISELRAFAICSHEALANGGWHFTFLDDTDGEKALKKYKSWAHSRDVAAGRDSYFEMKDKEEAVKTVYRDYNLKINNNFTSETHPKYLIDNFKKYEKYFAKE